MKIVQNWAHRVRISVEIKQNWGKSEKKDQNWAKTDKIWVETELIWAKTAQIWAETVQNLALLVQFLVENKQSLGKSE